MWWILLVLCADATELYRVRVSTGRVAYTDSPSTTNFEVVNYDAPKGAAVPAELPKLARYDVWDDDILAAAARYGVDAALLKAVCMQESAMNPKALSHAGAMGLMQLIPSTASDLGVQDPWDPLQNIDGGTRYIKQQLDTFGDVRWALAAYNAGPNAVRRYSGIPPYEETQDYVRKVMGYYALFSTSRPVGGTSAQP